MKSPSSLEAADRRLWEDRHLRSGPPSPPSPFIARHVRALRDPERTQRALDVACGTGRHTLELTRAGFSTFALDLSISGVRRATSRSGATGVVADARALPFRPESFDLIVKSCFLERGAFAPLARLLRPDGFFLIETFHRLQYERTGHPRAEFCLTDGELEALCRGVGLRSVDGHRSEPGPEGNPPALVGLLARRG